MLAFTREQLMQQLIMARSLIDGYSHHDPVFCNRVIAWLVGLEQLMAQLRLPAIGVVLSERGHILAAESGSSDSTQVMRRPMTGKTKALAAAAAVTRVQEELRKCIQEIDAKFDGWRAKMAQLVALAAARVTIPFPPSEPREGWLGTVWAAFDIEGESKVMYRYLAAAMSPSDRLRILDEMMSNLLAGLDL